MERYPVLLFVKWYVPVSVAFVVLVLPVNVEEPLDDFLVLEGPFDNFVHIGNLDPRVQEFIRTDFEPIRSDANERTLLAKALTTTSGETQEILPFVGTAVFVAEKGFDINPGFLNFLFEGVKDIESPASNATCSGTNDDSAVCPFHGVSIFFGTTLEKLFGNGHRRMKRRKYICHCPFSVGKVNRPESEKGVAI